MNNCQNKVTSSYSCYPRQSETHFWGKKKSYFIPNASLFYRMIVPNLPFFFSVPFIICLWLFIHPWNEFDLWELLACALISSCHGAFFFKVAKRWQEWQEGRELALGPCDIFTHVDAAGRHDVFFLPDTYREAQQSALNLTSYIGRNVLRVRLRALSSAGWLNCAAHCEDTF